MSDFETFVLGVQIALRVKPNLANYSKEVDDCLVRLMFGLATNTPDRELWRAIVRDESEAARTGRTPQRLVVNVAMHDAFQRVNKRLSEQAVRYTQKLREEIERRRSISADAHHDLDRSSDLMLKYLFWLDDDVDAQVVVQAINESFVFSTPNRYNLSTETYQAIQHIFRI